MFSNLIRRNGKKNYKEYGIYFLSLIMSIIGFYVILSLEKQDVVIFLSTIEGNAIRQLFSILKIVYVFSLLLLFALVYVAERFQLQERNHEFGLLLMMGMKRSRLFAMLMIEDMYTSIVSLVIGLPCAILLSEITSLVTARMVGLDLLKHHSSCSLSAAIMAAVGFVVIKLIANLVLSMNIIKATPGDLIYGTQRKAQRKLKKRTGVISLICGIVLLLVAYGSAIFIGLINPIVFLGVIISGTLGTGFVMKGIGVCFTCKNGNDKDCLKMFTMRQLKEFVFHRSGQLTAASILIMVAIICMAYGIAVSCERTGNSNHTVDYTLFYHGKQEPETIMQDAEVGAYIENWYEMKLGYCSIGSDKTAKGRSHSYQPGDFKDKVEQVIDGSMDIRHTDLGYMLYSDEEAVAHLPYLIPVSSWNELQKRSGKDLLVLGEHEVAFYASPDMLTYFYIDKLKEALELQPYIVIDDVAYELKHEIYTSDIVADRAISISDALIVSDELFGHLTEEEEVNRFWNGNLKKGIIEQEGQLLAYQLVNEVMKEKGASFESYLTNQGRQLFYIVAAGYVTIYLAIIFLLIANTIIGLQYSMQEKQMGSRYRTLIHLGADYKTICISATRQIRWFFVLPVGMAVISSMFGTTSLFAGMLPKSLEGNIPMIFGIAGVVTVVMIVIEWCYIMMIQKHSHSAILKMIDVNREE